MHGTTHNFGDLLHACQAKGGNGASLGTHHTLESNKQGIEGIYPSKGLSYLQKIESISL